MKNKQNQDVRNNKSLNEKVKDYEKQKRITKPKINSPIIFKNKIKNNLK